MIKKPPLHFYSLNVTMIYHRETNVEWQHLTVSGIASCMRGDILPQWSTKWSLGTLADDKWPIEGGVSQLTTQIGVSASTMSDSVTPWTVAHQAPLSVEFSRQEYWSGLPSPSPGDLPDLGVKPRSPALWANSLQSKPPGKPFTTQITTPNSVWLWRLPDTSYQRNQMCYHPEHVKWLEVI